MSDRTRHLTRGRRLSPAEARSYLDAPITQIEREAVRDLARWFLRRYPTPVERLAYVRRAYARWQRTRGLAIRTPHDTPP